MRILLTNDDGIRAEGLAALWTALGKEYDVAVVAPKEGRSGVGHGITFGSPIRADRMTVGNGLSGYGVSGTPADCVKIAVRQLYAEKPFDAVVSGINHGSNAGINTLYSGTVGGAAEGAILGLPSVAVSLARGKALSFEEAAELSVRIIGRLLTKNGRPRALTSVNIPNQAPQDIKGIRVTTQNCSAFATERFEKRSDPWGRDYFWLRGEVEVEQENADEDTRAMREAYISITPLKLNMTDMDAVEQLGSGVFDDLI